MQILVIVVNYNQVQEIGAVLERLENFHPREHTVIVDDGSQDGSPDIAQVKGFRVIRHKVNRGVGAALRTGYEVAIAEGYQAVAIMSSNGKIRPEDLHVVIDPVVCGEADYTTGSRFMNCGSSPGLPLFRNVGIRIVSALVAPLLGKYFSDITCGYRCYLTKIFSEEKIQWKQKWLDRYEMEYYLHYWACKLKYRIREVPVTIHYSHLAEGRTSKIVPFIDWWSMMRPFVLLTLGLKT